MSTHRIATGSKWDLYQEADGRCGDAPCPRFYSKHSDPLLEETPSLKVKEEGKGALIPHQPLFSSPFRSPSAAAWRLMSLSAASDNRLSAPAHCRRLMWVITSELNMLFFSV